MRSFKPSRRAAVAATATLPPPSEFSQLSPLLTHEGICHEALLTAVLQHGRREKVGRQQWVFVHPHTYALLCRTLRRALTSAFFHLPPPQRRDLRVLLRGWSMERAALREGHFVSTAPIPRMVARGTEDDPLIELDATPTTD